MTLNRILAIIIALLTLAFIFSGCSSASNQDSVESDLFSTIIIEEVGSYTQTLIYDKETMVEYVYLWHKGNGRTVSTMLYMPDGTPKLYSGEISKLILVSKEKIGTYTLSLMYDSETSVMYCCSWQVSEGSITMQPLYNANGNLKLYQNPERVP